MKKILVPVSFSETSKIALKHAHLIATQYAATLCLLHCFPAQEFNRTYDFGKLDYDSGIRGMIKSFYNECIQKNSNSHYEIITFSGSISTIISRISYEYDLMVMSRTTGFKAVSNRFFSDKLFYCSTKALCPVLITSTSQTDFSFRKVLNIWHVQRHDMEKEIVHSGLRSFGMDPALLVTKSLAQRNFVSDFWKSIVTYTKIHDKDLLKSLSGLYKKESIGLLILVNRMKGMFEIFLKDEAFQIISQYDIPILVLPSKTFDSPQPLERKKDY